MLSGDEDGVSSSPSPTPCEDVGSPSEGAVLIEAGMSSLEQELRLLASNASSHTEDCS